MSQNVSSYLKEVLQKISQKDDAIPLTEAEVGRRMQAQQEKRAQEGGESSRSGPQPPAMGEGSSIEERLEDFVDNAVGSSFVVMEGDGEFSKPMNTRRHPGFYQGHMGLLELADLRRFPRYLIDVILRPESAVILPEHYAYWQWTAQFVRHANRNGDEFDSLVSKRKNSPDFGYGGIVRDFLDAVEIVSFPRRMSTVDPRVVQFIQQISGLSSSMDEFSVLRLFGPNSLAALDGLVKRRCSLNTDGNLEGCSIEATWIPNNPGKSAFNYHDRLQYWRFHHAADQVQNTLSDIDELQRYDIEYLRHMGGVLGNTQVLEKELESTNHFLRIAGKSQRNYNIHGNGSASSIAPIVLSLCCLVFWDVIDEEPYQNYQEEILKQLRSS
jgi:hypothetical protein